MTKETGTIVVLTISEVAKQLSCSTRHIYRLIDAGDLAAVDIAPSGSVRKRVRIKQSEVNDYLERSTSRK